MQLMPATAARQAERLAIQDHHPDRLFEPGYNILLGSDHLADLLERYDGALLLALAAYNAGPGNVDNWLAAFGDPRLGVIAPEDWIESIPSARPGFMCKTCWRSIASTAKPWAGDR